MPNAPHPPTRRDARHINDLSPARRRLLELMAGTRYGRVEDLHVRGGEPLFDPRPRVTRTVKIAGPKAPPLPPAGGRELRREWLEVFAELDALGDGVVRRIELANGLPLFVEVVDR